MITKRKKRTSTTNGLQTSKQIAVVTKSITAFKPYTSRDEGGFEIYSYKSSVEDFDVVLDLWVYIKQGVAG